MRLLTEGARGCVVPSGQRGTASRIRLRGALVALPCWALIVTAFLLSPRAGGYGTHRQLGFPSCSFAARTRLPCPTCGMTTSMTAMSHGDVAAAFDAQPFGVVLFLAVSAVAIAAALEVALGRSVLPFFRMGWWCVWSALLGVAAGWGLKIAMGYADGTLPLR